MLGAPFLGPAYPISHTKGEAKALRDMRESDMGEPYLSWALT